MSNTLATLILIATAINLIIYLSSGKGGRDKLLSKLRDKNTLLENQVESLNRRLATQKAYHESRWKALHEHHTALLNELDNMLVALDKGEVSALRVELRESIPLLRRGFKSLDES